jgi:hypothetical protein
MRLDMSGIDHLHVCRASACGKSSEQPLPHSALSPARKAVVDGRVGTVLGRAIAPPTATFEHVDYPADHAAIVHALLSTNIRR